MGGGGAMPASAAVMSIRVAAADAGVASGAGLARRVADALADRAEAEAASSSPPFRVVAGSTATHVLVVARGRFPALGDADADGGAGTHADADAIPPFSLRSALVPATDVWLAPHESDGRDSDEQKEAAAASTEGATSGGAVDRSPVSKAGAKLAEALRAAALLWPDDDADADGAPSRPPATTVDALVARRHPAVCAPGGGAAAAAAPLLAVDIGAAPGAWTQELCRRGASTVVAVDPAALHPLVAGDPRVVHVRALSSHPDVSATARASAAPFSLIVADVNVPPIEAFACLRPLLPLCSAATATDRDRETASPLSRPAAPAVPVARSPAPPTVIVLTMKYRGRARREDRAGPGAEAGAGADLARRWSRELSLLASGEDGAVAWVWRDGQGRGRKGGGGRGAKPGPKRARDEGDVVAGGGGRGRVRDGADSAREGGPETRRGACPSLSWPKDGGPRCRPDPAGREVWLPANTEFERTWITRALPLDH